MYELEILIFLASLVYTCVFLFKWYYKLSKVWKPKKIKIISFFFGFLPLICFLIIYYTLKRLASFDVVNDPFYIFFYIFLGYVWIYIGIKLIFYFFDLSWIDDVLNNGNKASLVAICGAVIGLTLIYSGANIGDGPGFWCVIVAGGIGFLIWVILTRILNKLTKVLETVSISRDISCGIRLAGFFIASGLILARASGGDWTSLEATIIEFKDGWVVLPLLVLYIIIEWLFSIKKEIEPNKSKIGISIFVSLILIILAIISVLLLPPFKENPMYNNLSFIRLLGVNI